MTSFLCWGHNIFYCFRTFWLNTIGHREKAINSTLKVIFDKDLTNWRRCKDRRIFSKDGVTLCYPNFQTYTTESMSLLLGIQATFQIKVTDCPFCYYTGGKIQSFSVVIGTMILKCMLCWGHYICASFEHKVSGAEWREALKWLDESQSDY